MKAKIFTLLFGCAMITFGSMAQNFKTFTIDGALTIGAIRNATPGTVEVVVPADFDLTKCMVRYTFDAGVQLKDPSSLPDATMADLSAVKSVTVVNTTATPNTEKVINITVKKLNPATEFPFLLGFKKGELQTSGWTSTTVGWAFAGIDITSTDHAKYGTVGVSFIVGFPSIPADGVYSVDYNLWCIGKDFLSTTNLFRVEAYGLAANGIDYEWRELKKFDGNAPTLNSTTNNEPPASPYFSNALKVGDKYVKWVFVNRNSNFNLNLNNITVRQGVPTAINDMELAAVAVYPNPVQGTLHLTSAKEIAKVMLYSLDGQQVMQVNQPSINGLDVQHLVKGIYLVKVVFADQTVYTTKVTKK